MLPKGLLDDRGFRATLAGRLRPSGEDHFLVELDSQGLLGHAFMVPEACPGECTGFVVQAATKAAEQVLGLERHTFVPAEFFADLLAALEAPVEVPSELRKLAERPRSFERG